MSADWSLLPSSGLAGCPDSDELRLHWPHPSMAVPVTGDLVKLRNKGGMNRKQALRMF